MEACVDLFRGTRNTLLERKRERGPRSDPLEIHLWWFVTSGVVACHGVVPLPDSSAAHSCMPGWPISRCVSLFWVPGVYDLPALQLSNWDLRLMMATPW